MRYCYAWLIAAAGLAACATAYDPLEDYEELDPATVLDAPAADPAMLVGADSATVERGEYLVELLGCGSCHTDGALIGSPVSERALAGSRVGIAYTNPLQYEFPGVTYPRNLTPDRETGLGAWTDEAISQAIRTGFDIHGGRRTAVMPWVGYAKLTDEDVTAVVAYLRSIRPVRHRVPAEVPPGKKASAPFVYFGVYRSRN